MLPGQKGIFLISGLDGHVIADQADIHTKEVGITRIALFIAVVSPPVV